MKPQKFYKIALQVMSKVLKYFMLNCFNFYVIINSAYYLCNENVSSEESFNWTKLR